MGISSGNLRRIYRHVDEAVDEVKLHALEVFRSALSEPFVLKELKEHPDLELSRMLGMKKQRGAELEKAFGKNVVDAGFEKKLVQGKTPGSLDEALIVRAALKNGDEIRLTTTSEMFELAVFDQQGSMREAIRQTGPKLELLKGTGTELT